MRIWESYAEENSDPRNVEVNINCGGCRGKVTSLKFTSLTPIPPILRTCHESRYVGLKTYKPIFKAYGQEQEDQQRVIYLNPEADTLYVRFPSPMEQWDTWDDVLYRVLTFKYTVLLEEYSDRIDEGFPWIFAKSSAAVVEDLGQYSALEWNDAKREDESINNGVLVVIKRLDNIHDGNVGDEVAKIGVVEYRKWREFAPILRWDMAWDIFCSYHLEFQ